MIVLMNYLESGKGIDIKDCLILMAAEKQMLRWVCSRYCSLHRLGMRCC